MKLTLCFAVAALLLAGGCSDSDKVTNPGESDGSLNLMEVRVESIAPAKYTEGGVTEIRLVCDSRYGGRGHLTVEGQNGGNQVGTLISPVTGTVGSQTFDVAMPKGRSVIPLSILMTPNYHQVGLGIFVMCDSVVVGGRMVWWQSAEAWAVYTRDAEPYMLWVRPNTYMDVLLDRAVDASRGAEAR